VNSQLYHPVVLIFQTLSCLSSVFSCLKLFMFLMILNVFVLMQTSNAAVCDVQWTWFLPSINLYSDKKQTLNKWSCTNALYTY
jgi:hypothetical protein